MSTYDPTNLREQEREREEEKARRRLEQEVEDSDWKWLCASRRGRRIVWRLLTQAGVFRLSFSQNAMQMAFNEGNRNYGNWLLDRVNTLCPELYPVMVRENTERKNNDGGSGKQSN